MIHSMGRIVVKIGCGLSVLILGLKVFAATPSPPSIASLVKPVVYRRAIEDREIMSYAKLEDLPAGSKAKQYSFYSLMLVRASVAETRRALLDYKLYPKMISYVDRAEFSPETRTLWIEGGFFKFRLSSRVRFDERGDRWLHYDIVGGHFSGMSGEVYFESLGEKGTLAYFSGKITAEGQWPPTFVIERGAEIVFGFTGQRMRSYIESEMKNCPSKDCERKVPHDPEIPQPRTRL